MVSKRAGFIGFAVIGISFFTIVLSLICVPLARLK